MNKQKTRCFLCSKEGHVSITKTITATSRQEITTLPCGTKAYKTETSGAWGHEEGMHSKESAECKSRQKKQRWCYKCGFKFIAETEWKPVNEKFTSVSADCLHCKTTTVLLEKP